jgi:hypothetical protein
MRSNRKDAVPLVMVCAGVERPAGSGAEIEAQQGCVIHGHLASDRPGVNA